MSFARPRAAALAAALAAACAFPPAFTPLGPDEDPDAVDATCVPGCAGRCQGTRCIAAADGERCEPSGVGDACLPGARCESGRCVREVDPCAADRCDCPGALPCAGACLEGECVGAPLGGRCRVDGAGPPCEEGRCRDGVCEPDRTYAPVALDDWLATARAGSCAYLVRCDRWPASLADACGDATIPATPTFDSDAERVAAAKRGETEYSPQDAGNCLHALADLGCFDPFPGSCDRVFTGRLAEGARCTADATCQPELYCASADISGLACGGACAPRAAAGASCDDGPCRAGLVCVTEGAERRCRVRAGPGGEFEACGNTGDECREGLYCRPQDRVCVRRRSADESCDHVFGCREGLVCAFSDGRGTCLPRRARGESCRSNQQCSPLSLLVAGDWCAAGTCAALPRAGACVADVRLADRCDSSAAWCDEGRCRPFREEREPCRDSVECGSRLADAVCSFGQCWPPKACEAPAP